LDLPESSEEEEEPEEEDAEMEEYYKELGIEPEAGDRHPKKQKDVEKELYKKTKK